MGGWIRAVLYNSQTTKHRVLLQWNPVFYTPINLDYSLDYRTFTTVCDSRIVVFNREVA